MNKVASISIIWYLGSFMLFTLSGASIISLFLLLLPTLLHVIILSKYFSHMQPTLYWFSPIIGPVALLIASAPLKTELAGVQIGAVAMWQFIFIFALHIVLAAYLPKKVMHHNTSHHTPHPNSQVVQNVQKYQSEITQLKHQVNQAQQQAQYYAQQVVQEQQKVAALHEVTTQNMTTFIRSIEDKCKAINFVIGRVYSEKNGGSPQARSTIIIPRELYNEFSSITEDFKPDQKDKLKLLLKRLHDHLQILDLAEKDVTGLGKHGNKPIIQVLSTNDDDPVETYHTEAKAICTKLLQYLGR